MSPADREAVDHIAADLTAAEVDAILAALKNAGLTVTGQQIEADSIDIHIDGQLVSDHAATALSWRPDGHGWYLLPIDSIEGDGHASPEYLADGTPEQIAGWLTELLDHTPAKPTTTTGDVGKCPQCGMQSRSYSRGCSRCGYGRPAVQGDTTPSTTPTAAESWIFTFGSGQQHDGKYVVIPGTYNEARAEMLRHFGNAWSFQYPATDRPSLDEVGIVELPRPEWPTPAPTDVEILRDAARQVRQRAAKATETAPGQWYAVAAWLNSHATALASADGNRDACDSPDDLDMALTVARAILTPTSTSGVTK